VLTHRDQDATSLPETSRRGATTTFMASRKLPWEAVWRVLCRAIPNPLVGERLLVPLDDSIDAKTGNRVFACQRTFDHAAKPNQTRWPWAQTIVAVGLLVPIHGRWGCVPLAFGFYLRRETLRRCCMRLRRRALVFADKFAQAVVLIAGLVAFFAEVPVLVVTDSWFGNNGLFKPVRARLGGRVDLLSRLRLNATLYAQPPVVAGKRGRPRKSGERLGNAAALAGAMRNRAQTYTLHVYGAPREVLAADRVVVLKTLRCPVRVVWVYRKTQWVCGFGSTLRITDHTTLDPAVAGGPMRSHTSIKRRRRGI